MEDSTGIKGTVVMAYLYLNWREVSFYTHVNGNYMC
jgi:hypothetical protein